MKKSAKLMQEIRVMRFKEVYEKWYIRKLTIEQAAEILGIHESTFRRRCRKYEENGVEGLLDYRLGKTAHNAASIDEILEVLTIFETHYPNFTTAHFYDMYRDKHNGIRSYNWVKNKLQDAGLVKKIKKKGQHKRKRPRKPLTGMMLHQDGSTHEWVPDKIWDLIATLDDANSEIYSAFFVPEEGTWSSFKGVQEVIENKGLFCSFYTDRAAHYWYTPKVGGKVDKNNLTQFGRAMQQLGIDMIAAYSPEARGRSERAFRTLQDRLPKELALAGITTMEEANRYLKEIFLPKYNSKFAISMDDKESAFVPWLTNNLSLKNILCIKEKRTVNNDNTISYKKKILQIPRDEYRYNYAKIQVNIHEYSDGSLSIYYGHRCLGDYNNEGKLIGSKDTNKEYVSENKTGQLAC